VRDLLVNVCYGTAKSFVRAADMFDGFFQKANKYNNDKITKG